MAQFIKPKMIRIMNSLSIDRVKIKAGSFQMGSNEYLCDEKREFVLSKQVLRSSTAIGALVKEKVS